MFRKLFTPRVKRKNLETGITVLQIRSKGRTRIVVPFESTPFRFGETKADKGICFKDRIQQLADQEITRINNASKTYSL